MRNLALVGWMLVPVVGWAYHRGGGQEQLALDDVARLLRTADAQAADEDWAAAEKNYEQALALLPAERTRDSQRIRLERAKAQMNCRMLPEAHMDLSALVADLEQEEAVDDKLLAEARQALAGSQYYMTWLMRLEGEPESLWRPEIESARQTLRLLAEQAEEAGNAEAAERGREDLESAIRLARMDLHELQGLPLPSQ